MGDFKARTLRFWRDFGLSEYGKAASAAAREGRPLPSPPPEPHHYRTCRDEFCEEELCRAYREGLEDGRDE
jgi:hypothetical protein